MAGYDPYAASRIWATKYNEEGARASHLKTHPINSEREENTKKVANKVFGYYENGVVNPNFEALLSSNTLWEKAAPQTSEPGKGGGLISAINAVSDAYRLKYKAQNEELRQKQRIAFVKRVEGNSQLVFSQPVSENTWRVGIKYKGFTPLSEVVWRGVFVGLDGVSLEVVGKYSKNISYGEVYYIDFSSEQMHTHFQSPENVKVLIDNAIE